MLRVLPKRMTVNAAIMGASFSYSQVMRLINNVLLARLLSPQILGLMVIVTTVRTGVELLSDVGLSQNIVSHKKGDRPDFYDTAWTVQVARGLVLGLISLALAPILAEAFDEPALATLLPVASIFFVFAGFHASANALLQKRQEVKRLAKFEVINITFAVVIQVTLAIITPTIWALMLGAIISSAFYLVSTFMLIRGHKQRFMIDREAFRDVFSFGKWIFVSSLIYFAAMNFDRLYFATAIPLAALGIYGIARTLADSAVALTTRLCHMTLFPAVAESRLQGLELRQRLLHGRRMVITAAALGIGGAIAIAGPVVNLLYDSRYQDAAIFLPIMLVGVWFSTLSTINESVLVGLRKPAPQAFANLAKFTAMIIAIPIAFAKGGVVIAVLVLSLAEIVRYLTLWVTGRRAHVAFGRDDLALTVLLVFTAVLAISALEALGLPATTFEPLFSRVSAMVP